MFCFKRDGAFFTASVSACFSLQTERKEAGNTVSTSNLIWKKKETLFLHSNRFERAKKRRFFLQSKLKEPRNGVSSLK